MDALHVAGLRIHPMSPPDALDLVWSDVASGTSHVYAFVNGYSATLRRTYLPYAQLLEKPDVVCLPDGAAVTIGARVTSGHAVPRCPGPDVLSAACERAATDGTRFYLLGGAPGTAERLAEQLIARHPGLRIVGTEAPPFGDWSEEQTAGMCENVRRSGADVLWLGVSAPKQEMWAQRNLERLALPTLCVGAAFDFLAGNKQRAPHWMRRAGLEWLFRLLSEPRRLWKRYLLGNAVFLADLAKYGARIATPEGTSGPAGQ